MRGARGFSLIELTIAIGLIALLAATGAGLALANRSLAVAAAASEFDQLLDSARTMARELGGGRLSFAADGDGTIATFAATNPDGTLAPTTIPALHTHALIAEQDSLGNPAFALVLHADGRLGGIPNAASSEVGCPASGRYHIRITAAGGSADRFLPCRTVLATGGPLAYTVWPPATSAPSPVAQCAGPCTPPPLPTASSPALTCPSWDDARRRYVRTGAAADPGLYTNANRDRNGDSNTGAGATGNPDRPTYADSRRLRSGPKRYMLSPHRRADDGDI